MAQHLSYNDWMILVNVAIRKLCGMVADDLPDYLYHDAYNRGITPGIVARKAVAAAKKDMGI